MGSAWPDTDLLGLNKLFWCYHLSGVSQNGGTNTFGKEAACCVLCAAMIYLIFQKGLRAAMFGLVQLCKARKWLSKDKKKTKKQNPTVFCLVQLHTYFLHFTTARVEMLSSVSAQFPRTDEVRHCWLLLSRHHCFALCDCAKPGSTLTGSKTAAFCIILLQSVKKQRVAVPGLCALCERKKFIILCMSFAILVTCWCAARCKRLNNLCSRFSPIGKITL